MINLNIKEEFDAPVDKLYQAWIQAALVKQWFGPAEDMVVPEASLDVVEGGDYRIVIENSEGEQFIVVGTYQTVVPNERLVFSWRWENSTVTTQVELLFSALSESRSALELIHTEFEDQESCDHHKLGWTGCIAKLPRVL